MAKRVPHPRRRVVALVLLLALGIAAGHGEPAGASTKAGHHPKPPPVVAVGQPAPGSMNSVASVSCADADHCWAVGLGTGATAAIDVTTDGGVHWSAQSVPSTVTVLASVSCGGRLECVAVGAAGAAGAVLTTSHRDRIWVLRQSPTNAAAVVAVDCTSVHRCLAIATDGSASWGSVSTDEGATWTQGGALPADMSPTGVTCSSSSVCLATGTVPTSPGHGAGAIALSVDGGTTWTPSTLPTGIGILRDVTCATGICVAVGTPSTATTGFVPAAGQLLASRDGGATWQLVSATDDDAFGVACPESKVCVVVGTHWVGRDAPVPSGGIVSTLDGGTTWRPATLRYVPVGLSSVACPVVNQCVAAGGNVLVRVTLPVQPPPPKVTPTPGTRPGFIGAR
jgi:photosystem II stability/assembly factor-like uncharacterized protein